MYSLITNIPVLRKSMKVFFRIMLQTEYFLPSLFKPYVTPYVRLENNFEWKLQCCQKKCFETLCLSPKQHILARLVSLFTVQVIPLTPLVSILKKKKKENEEKKKNIQRHTK